jgi:activator of 2-hydroxyglutaryl-CoA dehydratase
MSQTRFTVIAIDGQDLQLIIIGDGKVVNFPMNKACVAGMRAFGFASTAVKTRIWDFGEQALQSRTRRILRVGALNLQSLK